MPECAACGRQVPELAVACPKCWSPTAARIDQTADPHFSAELPALSEDRRPGAFDVIHSAIRLYRRGLRTLITLAAIPVVPAQFLAALIVAVAPDPSNVVIERPSFTRVPLPPDVDMGALWLLTSARLTTVGIGLVATQVAVGLSFGAICDAYAGTVPAWRSSLSLGLERLRSLLWLAVIPTVLIGVGLLLGIVPGVWLYTSWALAVPVLLAEGDRGVSALRRSVRLVLPSWWLVFGVIALSRLMAWIAGVIAGSVLRLLGSLVADDALAAFVVDLLAGATAQTLITPFLAAVVAILYLSVREQEEALAAAVPARRGRKSRLEPGRAADQRRRRQRRRPAPG